MPIYYNDCGFTARVFTSRVGGVLCRIMANEKPICPDCGSVNVYYRKTYDNWRCNRCGAANFTEVQEDNKEPIPLPVCPECGSEDVYIRMTRIGVTRCNSCGLKNFELVEPDNKEPVSLQDVFDEVVRRGLEGEEGGREYTRLADELAERDTDFKNWRNPHGNKASLTPAGMIVVCAGVLCLIIWWLFIEQSDGGVREGCRYPYDYDDCFEERIPQDPF